MNETKDLGIEEFTRIVVDKLEESGIDITLDNPQNTSEFPCGVVRNPMKAVLLKDDNGKPIYSSFSITIEWWANKKYDVLNMNDNADSKLLELNFTRKGSPIDLFDEITKKYRYGGNYEVKYNGLANSFDRTN